LAIKEAEVNAIAAALDQANAGKPNVTEIKRLVDDLDVNRCATRILCDIYSDLKKYEQCIIPTSCAQNYPPLIFLQDHPDVEMVTFIT
jgi:hypothetical protein